VKEAYFRLARRFHPDTHADPAFADLGDKLEAVFIRLGEAYDVLKNPRTRGPYAADQASRQRFAQRAAQASGSIPVVSKPATPSAPPASSAPPPTAPPPPEPPPDREGEQREAQENVRKGEKLIEQEKFWDAIQVLEKAVPILEGRMRARARTSLARAYAKNPKWVRRAEELLQQTIAEEPRWPEAHMALGMIYKDGGLKSRALACFRKVLELKPEHEGAARELAELAPPPDVNEEEPPPPQPGLFRKLFGKG
jgi:tetratricopeptide (TPR) repeat protein